MGNAYCTCFERSQNALQKRRVLITGASGLLGRQLVKSFHADAWTVRGLAFSRAEGSLVKCDLFNSEQLAHQFHDFQPSIVIHCAAERRPDKLEGSEDYAFKINADLTRRIAEVSQTHFAWLIYLSTNYVFDGKEAPYAEDAKPSPMSVYGKSKLAGEQEITKTNPSAAIIRVPLLYGPIERTDETSVTVLLDKVKGSGTQKLDNWQERYPTNVEDLAKVIETMSSLHEDGKKSADAFSGVFHWQANERHTKYTMGVIIAQIAAVSTANLVPVNTAPEPGAAPRPQFERMLCTRLEELLGITEDSNKFRSNFKHSLRQHLEPFLMPST